MANAETINKWYQDWSSKEDTHRALQVFKQKIGGTDAHIDITKRRIITACFNAAHYKPDNDPGEDYRSKIQDEKNRIDDLAKAAGVLARSAWRNDIALSWAHDIADNASGVRITRYDHSEPKAHHLVMHDYFSQLETALKGKLPEISGGPFLHQFTRGNLVYDDAISVGKPLSAETMLAYELTFYLRMHTAGRAEDGLQDGQRMPINEGKPRFNIVAHFCHAVFGNGFDSKRISYAVGDIQSHVGLFAWTGVDEKKGG